MRCILRAASIMVVALAPVAARAQGTFVVRDVRLFDGERVAEHRSVVVKDGVISQVGGAEVGMDGAHRVGEDQRLRAQRAHHSDRERDPRERIALVAMAAPGQQHQPAPCVVVLHTGGWDRGSRREFLPLNNYLAKEGYAVAAIDWPQRVVVARRMG